jgi:hypothetical protein
MLRPVTYSDVLRLEQKLVTILKMLYAIEDYLYVKIKYKN